jgi:hypothetical protein
MEEEGGQEETGELNEKQKEFCRLYVSEEFFGSGVNTYLEVYDVDRTKKGWYNTACASASRLLSNVNISQYINKLLEDAGLNDQFIDKQILFLISQHSDFSAKLGAIREYNKIKGRITQKVDHTGQIAFTGIEIINPDGKV